MLRNEAKKATLLKIADALCRKNTGSAGGGTGSRTFSLFTAVAGLGSLGRR